MSGWVGSLLRETFCSPSPPSEVICHLLLRVLEICRKMRLNGVRVGVSLETTSAVGCGDGIDWAGCEWWLRGSEYFFLFLCLVWFSRAEKGEKRIGEDRAVLHACKRRRRAAGRWLAARHDKDDRQPCGPGRPTGRGGDERGERGQAMVSGGM